MIEVSFLDGPKMGQVIKVPINTTELLFCCKEYPLWTKVIYFIYKKVDGTYFASTSRQHDHKSE